ncbi:MAG: hypothetical protein NTV86_14470 [Planctomycetota bacterium]|nr:hypothetical protein [Planctomycetota bacterium]
MAESLEAAYVERFGRRRWQEYLTLLGGFWPAIRRELDRLRLDYTQVDLYQDGLPVCGRERQIVEKAAAMGSENHKLLLELMGRGATLMGTEGPDLLLAEYRHVQEALAREAGGAEDGEQARRNADSLARRDAWIGRRIGETLRPGRTGMLFLGMMHNVETHLPTDLVSIRVTPAILKAAGTSP